MEGLIEQQPTLMSKLWSPWSLLALVVVIIIIAVYFWSGGKRKKTKTTESLDDELDAIVEKIENSRS